MEKKYLQNAIKELVDECNDIELLYLLKDMLAFCVI